MKKKLILLSSSIVSLATFPSLSATCLANQSDYKEYRTLCDYLTKNAKDYELDIDTNALQAEIDRIKEVYNNHKDKFEDLGGLAEDQLPKKPIIGSFTSEYLGVRGLIGKLKTKVNDAKHKEVFEKLNIIPFDFYDDTKGEVKISYRLIAKNNSKLNNTRLELYFSGFIGYGADHRHCIIKKENDSGGVPIDKNPSIDYEKSILNKYQYNLDSNNKYKPLKS